MKDFILELLKNTTYMKHLLEQIKKEDNGTI